MRKSPVVLMLALVVATLLVGVAAQPAAAAPQAAQPAPQQKTITDPAEYNAYVSATQLTTPGERISGLEGFLQRYPNSVVKEEVLEALMNAYQQTGNAAGFSKTVDRLFEVNPNNLLGLVLMSYTKRAAAEAGQDPQGNSTAALTFAERGLKALPAAPKPDGMADADFDKLKSRYAIILNGAAGFGALQSKDYANAQAHLQAAVDAEPSTPDSLHDVYPLSLAYLEATPIDPRGLWYAARSVVLSNNNDQILKYARYKYSRYHGSTDDWDKLLEQAKAATSNALPPGFSVTPAPSPADQARNLANSKNPKDLTFDEIQVILTYGTQDVVDKVWGAIKGQPIPFVAKVVEPGRSKLTLAATYEDFQSGTADVQVTMVAPIPATMLPKVGDQIQLQAKPDSYAVKPFMVQMVDGQLFAAKKPPAHKPPARRRTH